MIKNLYHTIGILFLVFLLNPVWAGNPDRQGEAGAPELLLNPWARSIGLHSMTSCMVKGVESMNLNVAGLSRISNMEIGVGQSIYLQGSGLKINSFGFGAKIGKGSALGLTVSSVSFGKIRVTTNDLPEGTGATYSPSFFNLALGYSYTFENKIAIGVLVRSVNEVLSNVEAHGIALDAGVQYVTGPKDNFKLGVALRNIGQRMRFGGNALSVQRTNPNTQYPYIITYETRASGFDLPSTLDIGMSYDFLFSKKMRLTIIGDYNSNAYSRDYLGGGVEFAINNNFMLRGGYRFERGVSAVSESERPIYTGLCGGFTVDFPIRKGSDTHLGIDYGYVATKVFNGTHNITLRLTL